MATEIDRTPLTIKEYERRYLAGDFGENARVELIDGEVFPMSAIGVWHWVSVNRANALLTEKLGKRAMVAIQGPVRLDEWNEPEPDVTVFKPREDFYAGAGWPKPSDVLLVVEVADSSLFHDLNRKRIRYAKSGLADYWVVNLKQEQIHVFRDPTDANYTTVLNLDRGKSIAPLAFPDIQIAVDDLLGERPVES